MNITDSLKELYVAFGGNADDVATLSNITDISNAIAVLLGGEGDGTSISEAIRNIIPVLSGGKYGEVLAGVIDGSVTNLVIPDGIIGNVIDWSEYTHLKSLEISGGVKDIEDNWFMNCSNLETVTIGEGVLHIREAAFQNCSSLKTVTIPSSVTDIQEKSNAIPDIRVGSFGGCENLETITINKPENSISGAPWGATNATVVWTG